MDTSVTFASLEDECKHWKSEAHKYYKEHADCKEELDEFQESSQQLEAELEASLEQKEKQCRDLTSTVQQLRLETESLYKRLVSSQSDYTQLEQRHTAVTEERDQLKAYTRQLEQVNDNLERELRVVTENVSGFEAMLNEAYEKNALLEMEVDDKEKLQVMLQRLKDESRDLKQELIVRTTMASSDLTGSRNSLNSTLGDGAAAAATKTRPATGDQQDVTTIRRLSISSNHSSINNQHNNQQHAPANSVCIGGTNNGIAECKKHSSNVDGAQTMTTTTTTASTIKEAASAASTTPAAAAAHQSQNPIKHSELNGNAMSASSRLSALNLVAELLRKVNVMEARLKACRNVMPPQRHLREAHHITSLTPPIMQHHHHHLHQHNLHHLQQQTAVGGAAADLRFGLNDKRHATAGD